MSYFTSDRASHAHSLDTLHALYEYDDFMQSIRSLADMGSGSGLDLEWWATRTTRDELQRPLNIDCLGIDRNVRERSSLPNLGYLQADFESQLEVGRRRFDVIWCHDAFQYAITPIQTLQRWRQLMTANAMLVLILPQSTNMEYNIQAFDQRDHCYYNWTLVGLIHVLAVSGFDCRNGFFRKRPDDAWLHAVVYNTAHPEFDATQTSWRDLAELDLLPDSAVRSLDLHGQVRQRDLVLPWLDRALVSYAEH